MRIADKEHEIRGKRARRIKQGPQKRSTPATLERLARTVRRTPEVMVKITNARTKDKNGNVMGHLKGSSMRHIRATVKYISTYEKDDGTKIENAIPVENELGEVFTGQHTVEDALFTWQVGSRIPEKDGTRREAMNIVFSMPVGTDSRGVTAAVRNFASETFANHQYLFATHSNRDHPHVHLVVRMSGHNGKRLNPRIADLQYWREGFAEKLREQGIEANATRRVYRGVTRKAEKDAIKQIDLRAAQGIGEPSIVTREQEKAAQQEARTGVREDGPWRDRLESARRDVLGELGRHAKQLQKGNQSDRSLAIELTQFAQSFPQVETARDQRVAEIRREEGRAVTRANDKGIER